jgi:hypothetical protein
MYLILLIIVVLGVYCNIYTHFTVCRSCCRFFHNISQTKWLSRNGRM